jgi:hypothetical protein
MPTAINNPAEKGMERVKGASMTMAMGPFSPGTAPTNIPNSVPENIIARCKGLRAICNPPIIALRSMNRPFDPKIYAHMNFVRFAHNWNNGMME